MSLFQSLEGLLGGGEGGGVVQTLINSNGGLPGLLEKFQSGGLSEVAASWVSSGGNLPISPEQIQSVLGNEQVAAIASQLGVDPNTAAQQLAEHLPGMVDKLTPGGELPQGDLLSQGAQLLGGLFGKRD